MSDKEIFEVSYIMQTLSDVDRKTVVIAIKKYGESLGLKINIMEEHGYTVSIVTIQAEGDPQNIGIFKSWYSNLTSTIKDIV